MNYARFNDESDVYVWRGRSLYVILAQKADHNIPLTYEVKTLAEVKATLVELKGKGYAVAEQTFTVIEQELAEKGSGK